VAIVPPLDPFAELVPRAAGWLFGLDGVCVDGDSPAAREGEDWIVGLGAVGQIRLWALDTAADRPAAAVIARAGGSWFTAVAGFATSAIAAATGSRGAERCGFAIPVMAPLVGTETLRIFAVSADRETYGELCTVRVRSPKPLASSALPNNGAAFGALDQVTVDGATVDHDRPVRVPRGAIVSMYGWAIDRRGPRLAAQIDLDLPGFGTCEVSYGFNREDVARTLHGAVTDCGFVAALESAQIEPGTYRASLRVLAARRDGFTELPYVDLIVD